MVGIEVGNVARMDQPSIYEAFLSAENLLGAGYEQVKVWIENQVVIVTKANIAEEARRYIV